MKKFLSLLLALAMALGCTAFAEGVDYTDTWVLTGAESDGIQMGMSTLSVLGLEMVLTLNEDGTMVLSSMGVDEPGTWVANETGIVITDEEESLAVTYRDEMLVMEQVGATLLFTREGAAPAVVEVAGPVARVNVPAEEFEGQWLLTHLDMLGMALAAEDFGMYMALVLTEGAGIFGSNDTIDGSVETYAVTYEVAEVEEVGTVLTISPVEVAEGEESESMVLLMSEEGELFVDQEGIRMYFTKQVEEQAAE